jgi:stage III sporulation protein AE
MKRILLLIAILIITVVAIFPCAPAAADSVADDLNNVIDESLDNIDFSEVDKQAEGSFITSVVGKIKQILNGEFDSATDFLSYLASILQLNFKSLLPPLLSVLLICILCGIVTKNKGGLISEPTGNIIYLVCFSMVLLTLCANLFGFFTSVHTLLTNLSKLTDAVMPITLTLMVANGNNVTAAVYQPAVAMFSVTVIKIVSSVILPLASLSLVFKIISSLSDNIKVTKMSSFLTNISSWLLGIVFMVFSSFLSVQGLTAMSIDGVSIRAAKFATKNYIPILGGYLADGFDLILASSTLIKNAFGLVSLVLMLGVILQPLLTIVLYNLGLQAVSAVSEPMTDARFTSFFTSISKTLTFLAVLVIAVAFMFFIMIMLSIYTANV